MNKRLRTLTIIGVLLLTLSTVGLAAATMIRSADQLLTQALDTLGAVRSGHAVIEMTATVNGETMSGAVEVWGTAEYGPNGEPAGRLTILRADQAKLVGLTAVTDGSSFWLYDPAQNRVITGTADEMAAALAAQMAAGGPEAHELPFDLPKEGDFAFDPATANWPQTTAEAIAKLLEYVTAERTRTETVNGVSAYVLRLTPIAEKLPDQLRLAGGYFNVWLRGSDQLPLGVEYAQSALAYGKIMATTAETNIALDPALFTFAAPAGATVVQVTDLLAQMAAEHARRSAEEAAAPDASAPALTPAALPADATAAETSQMAGATVQRFTRADGRSFFVAQGAARPIEAPAEATRSETVAVRGVDGKLFTNDAGTRTLLTWPENGVGYLVGGDLSPAEALAIAESLR